MSLVKNNKIIFIIILFSFLISLSYSFIYRIEPSVDALSYDQIAVNLAEGFGFKEDRDKSYEFDVAIVRAGPGYEYFLAGLYKIFGHHYEIVWIVQAILHALTAYFVYLICLKIFEERGETIGIIAAAFIGFHPDLIEISAMLMTETFYLFFITLVVWIFVKLYKTPGQLRYVVFLSLAMATAILSRPPVVLFIPVILVYFLLNKNYKFIVAFLVCLGAALAPWIIRNYLIYHQFILTTMIGEYNLWVGNTLQSNGGQIVGGFNPLISYTNAHGFFPLPQKASQEFWSFVFGHPLIFIKLCVIRTIRYFSLIRPMGFWFYQVGSIKQIFFVILSGISIAVLFVNGFAGIVAALKEKKALYYYLIIFALTSPLVLIPTVVQSRYRFQIYPLLAIFGGYFLVNFFTHKNGYKKVFIFVSLVLLAVSFVDFLLFLPTVADRLHSLFIY